MRRIYYTIKPAILRQIQILFRRMLVRRQLGKTTKIWPILESAGNSPVNWKGWPDGKDFALVLTHDVELREGHDKCRQLLEIEKELGFKSSFNFVPERYKVDKELREFIVSEGFEVGVHGLYHDGKLFQNNKIFSVRAKKINQYLKEWNAVGFRAPAMQHNLEWIGKLDIEYDLSTFDTDPFEPQSDGVGTIFPFWFKGKDGRPGYVEMPYSLAQDFTLFILMKEDTLDIWYKKLNWITENGGMALVNVHPDYLNFENERKLEQFPISYYYDFLKYVKENYSGKYWNELPLKVAAYYKRTITMDRKYE